MSKELLNELRHRKDMSKRWKPGRWPRRVIEFLSSIARYNIRKAQAHLELNLPRFLDVKGNKKRLHKCTNSKRKTGEDVCLYGLGQRHWWQRPWKRLRYSVAFLPWSLPVKLTIRNPRPQKTKEKFGTSKTLFMEEDQIRENVTKLKASWGLRGCPHKCWGSWLT